MMDGLQVNYGVFTDRQQEVIVLLVLDEQVFGMSAVDLATQCLSIGNRIKRRMGYGFHRNPKRMNESEQFFLGLGHVGSMSSREMCALLAFEAFSLKRN